MSFVSAQLLTFFTERHRNHVLIIKVFVFCSLSQNIVLCNVTILKD